MNEPFATECHVVRAELRLHHQQVPVRLDVLLVLELSEGMPVRGIDRARSDVIAVVGHVQLLRGGAVAVEKHRAAEGVDAWVDVVGGQVSIVECSPLALDFERVGDL